MRCERHGIKLQEQISKEAIRYYCPECKITKVVMYIKEDGRYNLTF